MVSELGTNGKNSIDLLESWRHAGSALGCRNKLTRASKDIAEVPRYAASESLLEALLKDRPYTTIRSGSDLRNQTVKAVGLRLTTRVASPTAQQRFSFQLPDSPTKPFDIRLNPPTRVWYGVKRCRNTCDVDGFNTASLSSKKRRLRTELITSRLSQPYSQPATHILNREGQESGDKRFLKMATTMDTARRIAHLHATSFLRYSVMNRVRRRLGVSLSQQAVKPREHDQEDVVVAVAPAMKTTLKPQSLLASSAGRSLRPLLKKDIGSSPLEATSARPEKSVSVSKPVHPLAKTHACRLSKPAALPLPVSDFAASKKRTSPRIHPIQSPEMGPSLLSLDDVEEDSFAFLHPEDDDWDDGEDGDNVYSDFSVIFGQGSPVAEAQEERTYEEYLDELDGICWVTR